MAKKTTLLLIACLLVVSVCAFVSCSQDSHSGSEPYEPPERDDVENMTTVIRDIKDPKEDYEDTYFFNGDFEESTESSDVVKDGSNILIVEDPDDGTNHVLSVKTVEDYGCVYVDLTDYYGLGKSFYIEAEFKKNVADTMGNTNPKAPLAFMAFTVCSGAVQAEADRQWDAGKQDEDGPGNYYYYDEIYGCPSFPDDSSEEVFHLATHSTGQNLADGSWHKLSAILAAEDIYDFLYDQTEKYKADEVTVSHLYVVFCVGSDESDLSGYSYFIDNVVIKDLNDDIDRGGVYAPEEDEGEPEAQS